MPASGYYYLTDELHWPRALATVMQFALAANRDNRLWQQVLQACGIQRASARARRRRKFQCAIGKHWATRELRIRSPAVAAAAAACVCSHATRTQALDESLARQADHSTRLALAGRRAFVSCRVAAIHITSAPTRNSAKGFPIICSFFRSFIRLKCSLQTFLEDSTADECRPSPPDR